MLHLNFATRIGKLRGVEVDPFLGDLSVHETHHRSAFDVDLVGASVIAGRCSGHSPLRKRNVLAKHSFVHRDSESRICDVNLTYALNHFLSTVGIEAWCNASKVVSKCGAKSVIVSVIQGTFCERIKCGRKFCRVIRCFFRCLCLTGGDRKPTDRGD